MEEKEIIGRFTGDLKKIAELVGVEAAIKIGMYFRGTYIYIGSRPNVLREIRDSKIRKDYDRGLSVKRLSIKYGLTERYIKKILCGEDPVSFDDIEG